MIVIVRRIRKFTKSKPIYIVRNDLFDLCQVIETSSTFRLKYDASLFLFVLLKLKLEVGGTDAVKPKT